MKSSMDWIGMIIRKTILLFPFFVLFARHYRCFWMNDDGIDWWG